MMECAMLYDGDDFTLVHVTASNLPEPVVLFCANQPWTMAADPASKPTEEEIGYELINKKASWLAFITGDEAIELTNCISAWREKTPHEEEVINTLVSLAALSYVYPLVCH